MIRTKNDLKAVLKMERKLYLGNGSGTRIKLSLLQDHDYLLWKYVRLLRYTEYHFNCGHKLRYWVYQRKKNILGAELGVTLWKNVVDKGLRIWHYGCIIINANAKIGKNCQLHGDNCIGNKGDVDEAAPTLGDNIDVGVGAKIIGNVYIADNIKIGANAVVTKSCYEKGAVLVGVPAHILRRKSKGNTE